MQLLPLFLAAILLTAACTDESTATTTTRVPDDREAGSYQVVMESFAFTPAELTVPVGTTVTWLNLHAANHNVVADDGTFASPLFGTGETYSFTFTEPGTYPYFCSIHPSMRGTVTVTPP